MALKQITVTLDNVPGTLARLMNILEKEGTALRALTATTAHENGKVRLVADDTRKTAAVLESFGFRYEIASVIAAKVPSHPGAMNALLIPLNQAGINIDYSYTMIDKIGRETVLLIGTDRIAEAEEALRQNWIDLLGDES